MPNLIWIFGDQHRAQALSCAGDTNLSTPNLDALAGTSVAGIGGSPVCTPFRGALLTGRYPHANGLAAHDDPMPDGTRTVAHAFASAGYDTAYFGKWHIDGAVYREPTTPPAQHTVRPDRRGGFDAWIGYENNNAQYDCWVHGHDRSGSEVPHYRLDGYETDKLTDLLIADLDSRDGSTPFFSVLSVQPPHSPYVAPEEFTARHDPAAVTLRPNVPPIARIQDASRTNLAGYYAMIENLDWNVGRVMQALERNGLAENTIVVFFSDHGDMHGSHGRTLKCVPWEESIRIPFLVAGPGVDTAREAYPTLINHVDIAPTSLGLCGIETPNGMAGTDYSGCFLQGRTMDRMPDSAYLQIVDPGWRCGYASDRERPWRGIVTADGWKYAVHEGQPWLMYDLNEDPYEMDNKALDGRYRKKRAELQDRLARWMVETGDRFRLPDISWRERR